MEVLGGIGEIVFLEYLVSILWILRTNYKCFDKDSEVNLCTGER